MQVTSQILHEIGQYLKLPCTIILFLLMAVSVVELGYFFCEAVGRCKKKKCDTVAMLHEIDGKSVTDVKKIVDGTALLNRQKKTILRLLETSDLEPEVREAAARRLLEQEEEYYHKILSATNMVAKLGPMFGLLGTLIPVGPGIVALGQGDTQTLSQAMEYAFDTTIAGLISAAVCSVISMCRQKWYKREIEDLEVVMEGCLTEMQSLKASEKEA